MEGINEEEHPRFYFLKSTVGEVVVPLKVAFKSLGNRLSL